MLAFWVFLMVAMFGLSQLESGTTLCLIYLGKVVDEF